MLAQIENIAKNARALWFSLLIVLAFVGVTVLAHEDKDFFVPGSGTKLPLIGVDVPPVSFFFFAPVLVSVIYIHFHLYLLALWEMLGKAPSLIDGQRLEESVFPTLLTRAALLRKNDGQQKASVYPAPLGRIIRLSVHSTTWWFGITIVGACWVRSWALHSEWLTLWIAMWLYMCIYVGRTSNKYFQEKLARLRSPEDYIGKLLTWCRSLLVIMFLAATSWLTTEGGFERYWEFYGIEEKTGISVPLSSDDLVFTLPFAFESENAFIASQTHFFLRYADQFSPLYRANLTEAELARAPLNWLSQDEWRDDQVFTFAQRMKIENQSPDGWSQEQRSKFAVFLRRKREARGDRLQTISLQGADLRRARAARSFLAGLDLRGARLDYADLDQAQLVDVDLRGASLRRIYAWEADLSGSDLRRADLEGADVRNGLFVGTDLRGATLKDAEILDANVEQANIRSANLEVFSPVRIQFFAGSFGDAATKVGLTNGPKPCHWASNRWNGNVFYNGPDSEYDAWITGGAQIIERLADGSCPN
ncbi:MAG: pentapeptide repeat-containing protein [Bacteroidetes bacterium]|nr:pentapeptide repeat-containing protein [Bacteroidota bacterium]